MKWIIASQQALRTPSRVAMCQFYFLFYVIWLHRSVAGRACGTRLVNSWYRSTVEGSLRTTEAMLVLGLLSSAFAASNQEQLVYWHIPSNYWLCNHTNGTVALPTDALQHEVARCKRPGMEAVKLLCEVAGNGSVSAHFVNSYGDHFDGEPVISGCSCAGGPTQPARAQTGGCCVGSDQYAKVCEKMTAELLPQPGPQPSVTVTSNVSSTQRDIGYLGAYHPTKVEASRSPAGATTKSLQTQFAFGIVAIQNTAVDSGRNLEDDLVAHCGVANGAHQIIGLLLPPTEGGVVSNVTDTTLFAPPRHGAGLVQGAARWSKLARNVSACENGAIAGVVIDDFFTNYAGDAPGPGQPCAQCPANSSHLYGGTLDGYFCCPEELSSTHHCASGHECCLTSGSLGQHCQGIPTCGTNPHNYQPCNSDPGKTKITLEDMREIKGALQGLVVDAKTGKVDWTSPATTPDLRLWTVIYNRLVSAFLASDLVNATLAAGPAADAGEFILFTVTYFVRIQLTSD